MVEIRQCTTNFYPELCGVNVIVDPQAVLGSDDDRAIVVGQIGVAGTAGAGTLHKVVDDTRTALFGADSMLNRMVDEFYDSAPTAELWAFALPNTGTAGTSDITFTGTAAATASGIVYLWVNGTTYQASFDPTVDTDDTLAAKFQVIIDAADGVTAIVAANVVSITTDAVGEVGGFLDVRTVYDGRPDLTSSAEVTVAVATVAATGFPDLSAFAAVADGFEFVVNPYVDDTSIGYVSDYACGQWSGGANSRVFGVFYGDQAAATVFGQSANNALLSYMAVDGALTPSFLESASYGALAFTKLNAQASDIAASMTGTAMPAMLAPEQVDRFTSAEKATLVESGMGYFDVTRVNDVTIGRAVTTYTVRDNGSLDESLRDVNKPSILARISQTLREELVSKYTGFAFRTDGVVGGGSARVATVGAIRNFIIGIGQSLSDDNLVQNVSGFVDSITINVGTSGCIEITTDPELVDPFCCLNITLRTI